VTNRKLRKLINDPKARQTMQSSFCKNLDTRFVNKAFPNFSIHYEACPFSDLALRGCYVGPVSSGTSGSRREKDTQCNTKLQVPRSSSPELSKAFFSYHDFSKDKLNKKNWLGISVCLSEAVESKVVVDVLCQVGRSLSVLPQEELTFNPT
jgi:hypothetical protein